MKKSMLFIILSLGCIFNAPAQVPAGKNLNRNFNLTREKINPLHKDLISLSSESNYLAKGDLPSTMNFSIDTAGIMNSSISIVNLNSEFSADIPKNAYGFHNGRLILHTSGATSSGTITGSGVVGTGSSLGNIGSTGSGIGLNGKTPDAGTGMWGNARGFISIPQEKKLFRQ
ncbi:MAG: hypothetical protein ACJ75F_01420 [Flavisolibacter sp.]|jgi:hypothetical protein